MADLMVGILLGAIGGFVVGFVFGRVLRRPATDTVPTPLLDSLVAGYQNDADTVATLRQDLRTKLLHDEEKIRRAIDFERERMPGAEEVELLRAAIERWQRDNR
jgi:hypothetical protein